LSGKMSQRIGKPIRDWNRCPEEWEISAVKSQRIGKPIRDWNSDLQRLKQVTGCVTAHWKTHKGLKLHDQPSPVHQIRHVTAHWKTHKGLKLDVILMPCVTSFGSQRIGKPIRDWNCISAYSSRYDNVVTAHWKTHKGLKRRSERRRKKYERVTAHWKTHKGLKLVWPAALVLSLWCVTAHWKTHKGLKRSGIILGSTIWICHSALENP